MACLQVNQLQEERDKLAVAAAAFKERCAQIESLEMQLKQERSASAAAAADADRNLDAAKAVVQAARATVAAKERKASNLETVVEGARHAYLPLSHHVMQQSCMSVYHFMRMKIELKGRGCAELHKKVEENARLWGNVSVSLQAAKASALAVGLSSMAAAVGTTQTVRERRSPAQPTMPQLSQEAAGNSDGESSLRDDSGAEPAYAPPRRKGLLSKLRTARKPASRKRAAAYKEHMPLDQPCQVGSAIPGLISSRNSCNQ